MSGLGFVATPSSVIGGDETSCGNAATYRRRSYKLESALHSHSKLFYRISLLWSWVERGSVAADAYINLVTATLSCSTSISANFLHFDLFPRLNYTAEMFTGHCYCGKAGVEINCDPVAVVSHNYISNLLERFR